MNRNIMQAITSIMAITAILSVGLLLFQMNEKETEWSNLESAMGGAVEIECKNRNLETIVYGSGFIIDYGGLKVISNAHLVSNEYSKEINIIQAKFFNSEQEHPLSLIRMDVETDIAIFEFDESDIRCNPLSFNTNLTKYGEKITKIGNAQGYGLSISEGVVSVPLIQIIHNGVTNPYVMFSISINKGDSGGPIINSHGEVIGMITFRLMGNGNAISGMSYAIPSIVIEKFLSNQT